VLWSQRRIAAVGLAVVVLVVVGTLVVLAIRLRAPALPHGSIVLLAGTPYYWVADEAGMLHWPSDTRALVGRYVQWDQVRRVTLAELERLPRGEPWLPEPIAFVRAGSQLYLVKWESGLRWPAMLRVPSPEALAIFGVTSSIVEQRVVDRQTWERLTGLDVETLEAAFTPAGAADTTRSHWQAGSWSGTGIQLVPSATYPIAITLSEPAVDPNLGVVVATVAYPSLTCSGRLGLISVTAEEVLLVERLTSGLERCTDQGWVTLTRRTDERLYYGWSLPDDPMVVTGQLLRDDPAGTNS
jgi:hypothetical protein